MNPIHTFTACFRDIHFNTILFNVVSVLLTSCQ